MAEWAAQNGSELVGQRLGPASTRQSGGCGMIAVRVTNDMHYHVVASPEYLARHGRPRTPSELYEHNCIRYRLPDGRFIPWIFVVDGKTAEFDIQGSVVVL